MRVSTGERIVFFSTLNGGMRFVAKRLLRDVYLIWWKQQKKYMTCSGSSRLFLELDRSFSRSISKSFPHSISATTYLF